MKTIKQGQALGTAPKTEKVPFYIAHKAQCKLCKWEGEIEKGDKPVSSSPKHATFKCPTPKCLGLIEVNAKA